MDEPELLADGEPADHASYFIQNAAQPPAKSRQNAQLTSARQLRATARQASLSPTDTAIQTLELTLDDIATYEHQAESEVAQDADLMGYGICLNLRQVSADLRRNANPPTPIGGSNMPDAYRGFSLFVQNLTETQYRHLLNRYEAGQAVETGVHSVAYLSDYADYYRDGLVDDIIMQRPASGALPPNSA